MIVPQRVAACATLFVATVFIGGCGGDKPKLVAVSGKVTHKNQPLTAGSVLLVADASNEYKGEASNGQLQLDGSFSMRSFPHGDGVPPGTYKVTLSLELARRIGRPDYGDPAKTPLTLKVPDEGVKDHVIEIK